MALSKFGFIVVGASLSADSHRLCMRSDAFEMVVVGVSHPSEGPAAARALVESGVQLIELCGGFGPHWVAQVVAEIEGRVPVGAVSYACDAIPQLAQLFGA